MDFEELREESRKTTDKAFAKEYRRMQKNPDSVLNPIRKAMFQVEAMTEIIEETGPVALKPRTAVPEPVTAAQDAPVQVYVNYIIPDKYFDAQMTSALNEKHPDKARVAMHTGKEDGSVNWEESMFLPVKGKDGQPLIMHMSDKMKELSGLPMDSDYMIVTFPKGQDGKLYINRAERDENGVVEYRKYMEQIKAEMRNKIMKKLEPLVRVRDTLETAIEAARATWNKGKENKTSELPKRLEVAKEAINDQAKEAQKSAQETVEAITVTKVRKQLKEQAKQLSDKEVMELIVKHKMSAKQEKPVKKSLSDKEVMELIVNKKTEKSPVRRVRKAAAKTQDRDKNERGGGRK